MIKVARPPVTDPAISPIVAAAGPARQALLDAYANGRRPAVIDARYRAYKAALMKAFHGKCAYCDSFIDDNQPGHVEHYRPKKRVRNTDHSKIEVEYPGFGRIEHLGYFWLAYDWSNLLPACDLCNTYNKRDGVGMGKGDRFPVRGARAHLPGEEDSEEPLLIDLTRQDPGVHLSFARDGLVRGVTEEGEETVRLLGLNLRERLPRNRALAYDAAKHKLARFLNADVPKDELLKLRDQINALWEGREEHTAHARLAIEDIRAHFLLLGVPVPMPLPALV